MLHSIPQIDLRKSAKISDLQIAITDCTQQCRTATMHSSALQNDPMACPARPLFPGGPAEWLWRVEAFCSSQLSQSPCRCRYRRRRRSQCLSRCFQSHPPCTNNHCHKQGSSSLILQHLRRRRVAACTLGTKKAAVDAAAVHYFRKATTVTTTTSAGNCSLNSKAGTLGAASTVVVDSCAISA